MVVPFPVFFYCLNFLVRFVCCALFDCSFVCVCRVMFLLLLILEGGRFLVCVCFGVLFCVCVLFVSSFVCDCGLCCLCACFFVC